MQSLPFIDIRQGGPGQLIRTWPDRARAMIRASRRTLGPISDIISHFALPQGDRISRDWLVRTGNPFYNEIRDIAEILKVPGVYAFNLCFEWGCTSAVYAQYTGPTLTRVLDWRFPQLGENAMVVLQRGDAGDFYNVTWPGLSGMFQGVAPDRFAAALNQAPMQRHNLTYAGDWIRNRRKVFQLAGLPPAHLLRLAFERAADFHEATKMLAQTPVALPVIYVIAGVRESEGCVIERTERDHAIRPLNIDRVCAANHFESRLRGQGHGWRARPIDSTGRSHAAHALPPAAVDDQFTWYRPPIANAHSRLVMQANARTGRFSVFGTHGEQRVTDVFHSAPNSDQETADTGRTAR